MTKTTVRVFLRTVPGDNRKPRPEWYSKGTCVRSLVAAVDRLRETGVHVETTMVIDTIRGGSIDSGIADVASWFDYVQEVRGGNARKSLTAFYKSLPLDEWADSDLLYFVEDDHLHQPDALVTLVSGTGEYRFLNSWAAHHGEPFGPSVNGWRQIPGGTSSYGVLVSAMKRDRGWHIFMMNGGGAWDELTFRALGGNAFRDGWAYIAWPWHPDTLFPHASKLGALRHSVFRTLAESRRRLRRTPARIEGQFPNVTAHAEPDILPEGTDWAAVAAPHRGRGTGEQPAVTLVMPVHNEHAYLEEAVGSVQAQTFKDWRLLLVDDASTDGSDDIARRIASEDPRVHALRVRRPTGKRGAVALGFALAGSPYAGEAGADDLLHPEALARLVEPLEKDPTLDASFGGHRNIDSEGRLLAEYGDVVAEYTGRADLEVGRVEHVRRRQLARGIIPAGTVALLRRSIVGPIPRFTNTHTDTWLGWRAARTDACWYSGHALGDHRVHAANTMRLMFRRRKALDRIVLRMAMIKETNPAELRWVVKTVTKDMLILIGGGLAGRHFRAPERLSHAPGESEEALAASQK